MLELNERQTAKYITQKIEDVLKEYGISLGQVLTVTCDNGANMLAAVRELDKHLQIAEAEKLMLDYEEDDVEDRDELLTELADELSTKINLVRCAAHTLQLAVTDAIKHNDSRIRSITAVVKNCGKSVYKASFDLNNIPIPPLYAKTRWGGVFEMIANLNNHKAYYVDIGKQFKELDLSEFWEFIHDYINALRPVYVATKEMQAKHMSLGDFYIQWLRCLMEVRQLPSNCLAVSLTSTLQARLQQLQQNLAFKAALLVDPRFNYISSSVLSTEEKEETRKFIIDTSERLKILKPAASSSTQTSEEQNKSNSTLDDFMTLLFGGPPPSASQTATENTLLKQVNSLDLETHQNHKYDVWKHWTDRKDSHPELSEVALAVMAVPSTQVSVERSFSALGLVLSPARTNLSAENLQNILLIKLNSELLDEIVPKMYDWKEYRGLSAFVNDELLQ